MFGSILCSMARHAGRPCCEHPKPTEPHLHKFCVLVGSLLPLPFRSGRFVYLHFPYWHLVVLGHALL
jgi:hypothetical protein